MGEKELRDALADLERAGRHNLRWSAVALALGIASFLLYPNETLVRIGAFIMFGLTVLSLLVAGLAYWTCWRGRRHLP